MGIWQHTHTVTTAEISPDLGELAEILDDVSVDMIQYAIIEAVEPFKLHPTSMSYIYTVFEHLKQWWMGISKTSLRMAGMTENLPQSFLQTFLKR